VPCLPFERPLFWRGRSLESLAKEHLDIELDKTLQKPKHWQGTLTDKHIEYNRQDTTATLQLYEKLLKFLQDRGLGSVYAKELQALPAILRLHTDGIWFDQRGWKGPALSRQNLS
jgi:ribonuclease D